MSGSRLQRNCRLELLWMNSKPTETRDAVLVQPSAHRLIDSLRNMGHSPATAIADLVDNAISAGARNINISFKFNGDRSYISILDDGTGMTSTALDEAFRFGTRREYAQGELGRFGLGLKTASISMGRRLTVATRHAPTIARISSRILDLNQIALTDRWEIENGSGSKIDELARNLLSDQTGTVVGIEDLDRILPANNASGGWAKRRMKSTATSVSEYLGTVFHRFLERPGAERVHITVDDQAVTPWNPFAPSETHTFAMPETLIEIPGESPSVFVRYQPFVLPPRKLFSTPDEFERLGGKRRWNLQQGFYIYRADRLIQNGGWSGIRAVDEHTKLARAAVSFDTEADGLFKIDVAKMRVSMPVEIRKTLERSVHALCTEAGLVYRSAAASSAPSGASESRSGRADDRHVGLAIAAAAAKTNEFEALSRIMASMRVEQPEVANQLGW